MNFVKFWKLVKKHPWLPRIFWFFWEKLDSRDEDSFLNNPSDVGDSLIRMVRETGYISFRPWGKLDLSVSSSTHNKVISGCKLGRSFSILVFSHKFGQCDFVRRDVLGSDVMKVGGGSLEDSLTRLESDGMIIDAIVVESDESYTKRNYNIFLPPPQ